LSDSVGIITFNPKVVILAHAAHLVVTESLKFSCGQTSVFSLSIRSCC